MPSSTSASSKDLVRAAAERCRYGGTPHFRIFVVSLSIDNFPCVLQDCEVRLHGRGQGRKLTDKLDRTVHKRIKLRFADEP